MPNYRYECKNIVEYCFYKAGLKPTKDELEFILDRTKECVSDWHRVYTLFMSIKDDQEFEGTLISLYKNIKNDQVFCQEINNIIKFHRKRSYFKYLN